MKLIVNHFNTSAVGTAKELNRLRESLAIDIEGAEHANDPFWDGKHKFMTPSSRAFKTGLLGFAVEKLTGYGISVEIEDTRVWPELLGSCEPLLGGLEEREYQEETIKAALAAKCGIINAATNAGKTEIACSLIKRIGRTTLFLVHRSNLLTQTVETLSNRLGVPIGIITPDKIDLQEITVAMVPTLNSRIKGKDKSQAAFLKAYLEQVEVLIGDECHHMSSDTWLNVAYLCKGALWRYGLSGTPFKDLLSNLKLMSVTGPQITRISNAFLISEGVSAKPTIYMVLAKFPKVWGGWPECYEDGIVYNEYRNKLITYFCDQFASAGLKVFVPVNRRDQGERIMELLSAASVKAGFAHGDHDTDERSTFKQRLNTGEIGVLVSTTIFDEGDNIPNINAIIFAGGMKSNIQALQRIGRGIRRKEGDNILTVIDFIDDSSETLLKHTEERVNIYLSEGFDVEVLDNIPDLI